MQKDYETFVEKLEIGIYEATGIPRENISFEKEGGRFAPCLLYTSDAADEL